MIAGPLELPDRIDRVRDWMRSEQLDSVVVSGQIAVNHIAGYWRYFGSPAAAIVEPDGPLTVVVVHDEVAGARELLPDAVVRGYGKRGFGLVPDPVPQLVERVVREPSIADVSRIGVGGQDGAFRSALAEALSCVQVDAEPELAAIRIVKDAREILALARAYELAWVAQHSVGEQLREGITEIELFSAAQSAAQVAAGEPIEFFGDLLCGARTAEVCAPVRVAGATALRAGDALIADLVVGLRGYWGDTAETLAVAGNTEVLEVRDRLVTVRETCARELVPGRRASEVYELMSEEIAGAFPEGEFPHHGGHALGLGSYEAPHIIADDHSLLERGMVIALEPGVYFPGRWGARVEQTYLVEDEGGVELMDAASAATDDREHARVEHQL